METFIITVIVIVGVGALIGSLIPTTPPREKSESTGNIDSLSSTTPLKENTEGNWYGEDMFDSIHSTTPPKENEPEPSSLDKPKPKVTHNPIKWGKYTLIINSTEKKFTDIYNFQTPSEYKEQTNLMLLANALLFEEARLNKLSPDNFEELLVGFSGDTVFHKLVKPVGDTFFDFAAYNNLYTLYIDYRAREIRPIISMMSAFQSLEGNISKEEIKELSEEYEGNPMFGRNV